MLRLLHFIFRNLMAAIELLLLVRIGLRVFAANPSTKVVSWVYSITDILIDPVRAIFPNIPVGSGVIDIVALSAMVFYGVVFLILLKVTGAFRND